MAGKKNMETLFILLFISAILIFAGIRARQHRDAYDSIYRRGSNGKKI